MANTLTNLAAELYKRADFVGREAVGAISSATINSGVERVALNQTLRSHFTRQPTVQTSYSPAMTIPEGDDQTVDNKSFTITQVARVSIPWTGEDVLFANGGAGFDGIYSDQITQAMRGIVNTVESYVIGIIRKGASRAFGTAGTTPFGSNFNEIAELRQILVDNGCPMDNQVTCVVDTKAGTKLRNLAQLQKVNESGGDALLRQGELLNLQQIRLKESAGVPLVTKGTGASYLVNNVSTILVGGTTIAADTGTGTILAGDVTTFAADTVNKYVVKTALSGGNFVLNDPGIRTQAIPDNNAITVGNNFTANVCFHRAAVEIAFRPPAMPMGGDAAVDRMTVQDPHSGLVFELALYKGYGKQMLDITTFYDAVAWKPQCIALLLG